MIQIRQTATTANPSAEALTQKLQHMHDELRTHLESARVMYKKYHDRHAQPLPMFQPRDLVWLKRTHIKSVLLAQKLDSKHLGPF